MKTYSTDQIRNIVLLGNSGAGKTLLAETMLFEGKIIDRRGDIDSGNTVSDYHDIEQENGNSVFPSVLHTISGDKKINIIDAPGLDDFVGGAITGLHVADTTLIVINGQNGVEVGAEIHNRYASQKNKPTIIAVNQLDHDKANFEKSIETLKESFGANVVLTQYPVAVGADFNAIIDLVTMKMFKYGPDGGKPEILDIPDSEKDKAEELHGELIEKAAESDEKLMEIFFENDSLTEEEMMNGLKKGIISRGLFPVLCVSAKKNIGVGRMSEFIANSAPSPAEMPVPVDTDGEEHPTDASGPASLFVF
ncbi:MAG: elongation factor G, partial [Marinilabiliales bacterium]